jgi:hypothetical protein
MYLKTAGNTAETLQLRTIELGREARPEEAERIIKILRGARKK